MVCTKPKKTPSCVDSGTVLMLRGPGAERTHPLLTGLPRRGVLGNSPAIKTSRIFLPLETCRCVPSAKAQGSMPSLPFSLTGSPPLISCNYCYSPRRADRKRPMEATDGHGHPVRVSADVLEGLDAVVLSGETDMNDAMEVQ